MKGYKQLKLPPQHSNAGISPDHSLSVLTEEVISSLPRHPGQPRLPWGERESLRRPPFRRPPLKSIVFRNPLTLLTATTLNTSCPSSTPPAPQSNTLYQHPRETHTPSQAYTRHHAALPGGFILICRCRSSFSEDSDIRLEAGKMKSYFL